MRIERLMKRSSWSRGGTVNEGLEAQELKNTYVFGSNTINFGNMSAHGTHGMIQLTDQEVRLLKIFIANRGKPLSRRVLLEVGWGYSGETTTRTVDNFIVRLRKYFESVPENPVYFKSIRSIGYIFDHL